MLIILFQFFGYKLIVGLAAILVVLLVLVYFNQNKILYIPRIQYIYVVIPGAGLSPADNPVGYRHPSEQGCESENVEMTTSDGLKLRGWLLKGDNSERIVIYFH